MPENLHEGHRKRLRDSVAKNGAELLEDHVLLEMLLFYCVPQKDTNETAHRLLKEFGGLSSLLSADPRDIMNRCKVNERIAVYLTLMPEVARRFYLSRWGEKTVVNTPAKAGDLVRTLLSNKNYECFYVICLDSQKRLLGTRLLSEGTTNEATVYPRDVAEAAMQFCAHSVILAHNHPGGSVMPSFEDILLTDRIISVLRLIDVAVEDHIVLGGREYLSMWKERIIIDKNNAPKPARPPFPFPPAETLSAKRGEKKPRATKTTGKAGRKNTKKND